MSDVIGIIAFLIIWISLIAFVARMMLRLNRVERIKIIRNLPVGSKIMVYLNKEIVQVEIVLNNTKDMILVVRKGLILAIDIPYEDVVLTY